ncbi:JAB domain-containing protein [Salinisphaera hydrothermalis]|uniref:JAB domain-containing protein n=1 Tax=Salinisphaera hydrothermalis TaxID=563188 RepID=UPI003340E746
MTRTREIRSEERPHYGASARAPASSRESDDQIIAQALEILERRLRQPGPALSDPNAVRHFLRLHLSESEHEVFWVLFLDNQNQLLHSEPMFRGTIDGARVYPREILKTALKHNAAAIICAHNHPSGSTRPSAADRDITTQIRSALEYVDIRLLDHLIIARDQIVSFAEQRIL